MDDPPGWYGKISSLGDFAHRRLSAEWIAACDRWLSTALTGSRAELGATWLETYLTAPVLGFVWSPGTIDDSWWFGVLMASCDNVGRYFPLVVAQPRSSPPADRAALAHLDEWYAQVAEAAVSTLSDADGSLAAMETALAEIPLWPASGTTADRGELSASEPLDLLAVIDRWAARAPASQRAGRSAWWASTEGVAPSIVEFDGLPDGPSFGRLLDALAVR